MSNLSSMGACITHVDVDATTERAASNVLYIASHLRRRRHEESVCEFMLELQPQFIPKITEIFTGKRRLEIYSNRCRSIISVDF